MARRQKFIPPGTPADYRILPKPNTAKKYEYAPNGVGTGQIITYRAYLNLKEKFNDEGWTDVRFTELGDLVRYGRGFRPAKKYRGYVNAYGTFKESYRGSRNIAQTEGWRNIHPGATFDELFTPDEVLQMQLAAESIFDTIVEYELSWRIER